MAHTQTPHWYKLAIDSAKNNRQPRDFICPDYLAEYDRIVALMAEERR